MTTTSIKVQIEFNNPHYANALADMAEVLGITETQVCAGIIEEQINSYLDAVRQAKFDSAYWKIGEGRRRQVDSRRAVAEGQEDGLSER